MPLAENIRQGGVGLSAKIVMVASGKGGTGKSTLSVMLGARLAAAGGKVLLIELDSGLRSVDIIAGVYGKTVYDIADVLSGRCEGAKAVVASPVYPGLSVISAPYEWSGTVQPAALKKLLDKLSPVFDWVLVDTAAGLGAPFKAALAVSETVLLVLTPDPVTLRDGHIAAEEAFAAGAKQVRLVLNRVGPASFGGAVRDLDECIDTVAAQLIAVVPESSQLQLCAAKGQALPADCLAFRAVDNLARRLQGQRVPLAVWG